MLSKLIFSWLLSTSMIVPMEQQNDKRDLYTLYVINHNNSEIFAFEYAYEEEILEYIESGDFEYNECLRVINDKLVDICSTLTQNK